MRKTGALIAAAMVLACVTPAPAGAAITLPPLGALAGLTLPSLSDLLPIQLGTSASTHGPDSVASLGVLRMLELPPPGKLLHDLHLRTAQPRSAGAVRRALPTRWCGTPQPTDSTAHQFHNGAHRYHAIYAHARDAPDRLVSLATGLQTDAFQASALIERDYGRAIRLDLGTSCGARYLDITDVTLPQTTAQLKLQALTAQGTFDTVARDLDTAGFKVLGSAALASPDNYIVWLDGPAPAHDCGQGTAYADTRRDRATNINARGGKVALVYRLPSGFCDSNGLRHEIGHNLGAVQSPAANGRGHCTDARQDTMCLASAPSVSSSGKPLFDYRDDDYWDPKSGPLGWWTVDLSPFICTRIACNVVR